MTARPIISIKRGFYISWKRDASSFPKLSKLSVWRTFDLNVDINGQLVWKDEATRVWWILDSECPHLEQLWKPIQHVADK